MPELRFADLSALRKVFVQQCQRIGYGRIEHLEVHACEPVFGPETESFVDVKLDSDDSPQPELDLNDFAVRAEIRRFFSKLDAIRNGVVDHLEVRAGIPRRILLKVSPVESQ